jgi:alpha-maltose-1-phosphate synthase
MRVALLKGNRFNPWHLLPFNRLGDDTEVTAFRAHSEIQQYFDERAGAALDFQVEDICFDTQRGPLLRRLLNRLAARYGRHEARILPFHERLAGFDVIQTWELFTDWTAEALEARRRWNIPVSVMVWDNIPFNMERDPARRSMKEAAARNGDCFIVHTERSRRMLDMEGVNPDRVCKIDPGVDTNLFSPGAGGRTHFGIGEEEFVILFVGWLLPRKGLDFLLLALRELIHDSDLAKTRVRLLVVGSGPGRDRIEKLMARLELAENVTLAGSLPYSRMPVAFRSADVFVLPSIATPEWQEQFGMSLIEAMACGVPVVSTLSGAIPEVVEDAAVLCQPNDFVSLYEALKELILTPAKCHELAALGRVQAVSRFTLEQYAAKLAGIYRNLPGPA